MTSTMGEPTTADLAALIKLLAATVDNLQAKFDALQQDCPLRLPRPALRLPASGEHHNDRPPRLQTMESLIL
jgi:hypothetical protein